MVSSSHFYREPLGGNDPRSHECFSCMSDCKVRWRLVAVREFFETAMKPVEILEDMVLVRFAGP